MEKELFILTVVNGEGELISVEAFKTHERAHEEMERSINAEIDDARAGWYEDEEIFHNISDTCGYVQYGDSLENSYEYKITKVKNPYAD